MLKEGDKAPSFELPSDGGDVVQLADFRGKPLVVYFYPRDNTPGCTREAQEFSAANKALAKLGASVVGISRDSIASHCNFRDKYALTFPLLSDTDLAAHKAFGAWGEKTMYGKKVLGTIRSTFVIGPDGRLLRVFRGVKVDGHAEAVMDVLRGGDGGKKAAGTKTVKAAPAKKAGASGAKKRSAKKSPAKKSPAKKAAGRKR
jgi:thioredoxin-dependent peroxiredoxin